MADTAPAAAPAAAPAPTNPAPGVEATAPMRQPEALACIRQAMTPEPAPQQAPAEEIAETNHQDGPTRMESSQESHAEGEGQQPEPTDGTEGEKPAPDDSPETSEESAGDGVEVPQTVQGLAEMLNVDVGDLVDHLQIEIKGDDGTAQTITLAEAIHGTMRTDDYTQKTQQLAEDRRQFDANILQATQTFQMKQQHTDDLLAVLQAQINTGPTDEQLTELLDYDPEEHYRQKALRDNQLKAVEGVIAHQQQERQQSLLQQQQLEAQNRHEQQRLFSNWLPEVKDATKLGEFETGVREYLTKDIHPTGTYSSDEVDNFFNTYDARQALILKDAMAYRALQKGGKEMTRRLKAKTRVLKPNAVPARDQGNQGARMKSQEKLRRYGSGEGKKNALDFIRERL